MTKHQTISILALLTLSLVACQPASPPERPLNQGDRPRVIRNAEPIAEVLPFLQVQEKDQKSEFKLRSQTSRYLDSNKTQLEITLSSSDLAFCKNETPNLKEGEEQLQITVKTKDGKTAVSNTELAKNPAYEVIGVRKTLTLETKLSPEYFQSLKITDLNNAIARGNLKIAATDLSIEGEFFTAICK